MPKALIAGLAKVFVQLTQGEEPDLGFLNDEVKKEINRYFYLFYNKDIEEEPQGDRHLHDLLEFNKLDKSAILSENNTELYLSKQNLASVCRMSKFYKLGIIPTLLKKLDLSNN